MREYNGGYRVCVGGGAKVGVPRRRNGASHALRTGRRRADRVIEAWC